MAGMRLAEGPGLALGSTGIEVSHPIERVNEGVGGVVDFIADAPHDDGGMIAIPQHHVLSVANAPLFE